MGPARCLIAVAAAALASTTLTAAAQSLDIRASEIVGRQVRTSQGELLTIRDLLIDPRTRRVEYLALSRAGVNGEEAQPPYPASALRSGAGKELRFVHPDAASAGSGAPLAYLRLSQLGRLDDMIVRLTDGTVSLTAPPPP
jgi:PRC-barrel domain